MNLFRWIDSLVNKLVKNYTLWIFGGLIILAIIAVKAYSAIFIPLLEPPVFSSYRVLQTEWTDDRRERYYQTSQGSLVMPYAWFRALEWRTGTQMWTSPEVQVKYGLLPDNDTKYNPDRMPIGIVKEIVPDEYVDDLGEGQKEWASLTCAACHTSQIQYKGTALRIDGGEGQWRFEQWSSDLVFSLVVTTSVPSKFERFCARVNGLKAGQKCSTDEKKLLHTQLKAYFNSDLIMEAVNAVINHIYPTQEGFMRTDALGRGVNGVFGPLNPNKNINRSTGSVSYPPLWYTHDFDWVQSPAAIRQPLGRNVTEGWGVNIRVEVNDPNKRFGSTAELDNMFWMESLLATLRAPKWPEDVLGPIDHARAERGKYLFNEAVWSQAPSPVLEQLPANAQDLIAPPNPNRPKTGYCARCHAPTLDVQPNQYGRRYIQLPLYRMTVLGTDSWVLGTDVWDAKGFNERKVYTGVLAKPSYNGQEVVGIGTALTTNVTGVLNKWFQEHNISEPCQIIMEGYRPNEFRAPLGYPARPLDGYWATGPFLHNGSVRTLYQLLSPLSEREKTFWIGSWEFDPVNVGFVDEKIKGAFLYDTSLRGNSNAGHEFRDAPPNTPGVIGPYLTPEQRLDLIEYLKVLDSVQMPPEPLQQHTAVLNATARFYEGHTGPTPVGAPEENGGFKKTDFCAAVDSAVPTPTAAPAPAAMKK